MTQLETIPEWLKGLSPLDSLESERKPETPSPEKKIPPWLQGLTPLGQDQGQDQTELQPPVAAPSGGETAPTKPEVPSLPKFNKTLSDAVGEAISLELDDVSTEDQIQARRVRARNNAQGALNFFGDKIETARNIGGLAKRMGQRFLSSFIEFGGSTKEEREIPPGADFGIVMRALAEVTPKGESTRTADPEKVKEAVERLRQELLDKPEFPTEKLARKLQALQETIGPKTPPESIEEKVADTIGGLTAFITRLALVGRVLKTPLSSFPSYFRGPIVWELENRTGPQGEGAAMNFGLQAINALPVRTPFKIASEMIAFGALAAAHGADEVDIYIATLIPPVLRGVAVVKAGDPDVALARRLSDNLRKARTAEDFNEALIAIGIVGAEARRAQGKPADYVLTREEVEQNIKDYTRDLTETDQKARAELILDFRQSQMRTQAEAQEAIDATDALRNFPDDALELFRTELSEGRLLGVPVEGKDGRKGRNVQITEDMVEGEIARRDVGVSGLSDKQAIVDHKKAVKELDSKVRFTRKNLDALREFADTTKGKVKDDLSGILEKAQGALDTLEAELTTLKKARPETDQDIITADKKSEKKFQTELKQLNKELSEFQDGIKKLLVAKEISVSDSTRKSLGDLIKTQEGEVAKLVEKIKTLEKSRPKPRFKAVKKGEFIGKGKLPKTDFTVGDTVRIGEGANEWKIVGGRRDADGVTRVLISKSVPDTDTGGGRKIINRWARADRLNLVKEVTAKEVPYELPEPVAKLSVLPPKPTNEGRLIYNLNDPKAFIVSGEGAVKPGAEESSPLWLLRLADGTKLPVDQGLVQGLIDSGKIKQLGKGVWGIPEDKILIPRPKTKLPSGSVDLEETVEVKRIKISKIGVEISETHEKVNVLETAELAKPGSVKILNLQLGKLGAKLTRLEAERTRLELEVEQIINPTVEPEVSIVETLERETTLPELKKIADSGDSIPASKPFVGFHLSSNIGSFINGIEQRLLGLSVGRVPEEVLSAPIIKEPKGQIGLIRVAVWGRGLDYANPNHKKLIDDIMESVGEFSDLPRGERRQTINELRRRGYSWVNEWNSVARSDELHILNTENVKILTTMKQVESTTAPALRKRIAEILDRLSTDPPEIITEKLEIELLRLENELKAGPKVIPVLQGEVRIFRKESPGEQTQISKFRGRFFAESEQGIEDALILAPGTSNLLKLPTKSKIINEIDIVTVNDIDGFVKKFATPKELKILRRIDPNLVGDGPPISVKVFKQLQLPQSLSFLIGQRGSLVPVLEVIAARGARREGVKYVRITDRGGGLGGITEIVEIPTKDGTPPAEPGSNFVSKLSPTKAIRIEQLTNLVRDQDRINELLSTLEKVRGGKPETERMTGVEQSEVLGPDVTVLKTFEEARNLLLNTRDSNDLQIKRVRQILKRPEPTAKPAKTESEIVTENLEQSRDRTIDDIKRVSELKLIGAHVFPERTTLRRYEQGEILGTSIGELRTFNEAMTILEGRLALTNEQLSIRGKKAKPRILARVGPDAEPVPENDSNPTKRFGAQRPQVYLSRGRGEAQFIEEFNRGMLIIPKTFFKMASAIGDPMNNPQELYRLLLADGRIKEVDAPKQTATRKEAQAKLPEVERDPTGEKTTRTVEFSSETIDQLLTEGGRGPKISNLSRLSSKTLLEVKADEEAAVSQREQSQILSEAMNKLDPHQQVVIDSLRGIRGRPQKTMSEVAKLLDVSVGKVAEIELQAILDLRIAAGREAPGTTIEETFTRHPLSEKGLAGNRRGMAVVPTPSMLVDVIRMPFNLIGKFVTLESGDMVQLMRRRGGKVGGELFQKLKSVIDLQKGHLGAVQTEGNRAQTILNNPKVVVAAWDFQHGRMSFGFVGTSRFFKPVGFGSRRRPEGEGDEGVRRNKNGLAISGQRWVVDPAFDLVDGLMEPRSKAEKVIVDLHRQAALTTGAILESEPINLKITIHLPDGTAIKIPFQKTPEGKVHLAMPTAELYTILGHGPGQKDGLWEAFVEGLSFTTEMKAPEITKILLKLRDVVIENNAQSGYRHIGPEFAKAFPRRPTALLANNGWRIQVFHTEPRKYLDSLYTSSSIRAGFIEVLGQDGKKVKDLRDKYVQAGGDPFEFDNTIRSMSDITPLLWGLGRQYRPPSPATPAFHAMRNFGAAMEFFKQGLLSGTAPIQASEFLGFSTEPGFRHFMRGLADVAKSKVARDAVMDELHEYRLVTKDVVALTIDRSHFLSDFMNKAAGVLSRLHFNKQANEVLNEIPAGLQGRALWKNLVQRAVEGRPVRPRDIYYMQRLLEFTPEQAKDLARGTATSELYQEMARRSVRHAVGSTAIMSEKSILRNTRFFRFSIPFTGYFSNRFRSFALHLEGVQGTSKSWVKTHGDYNKARDAFSKDPNFRTRRLLEAATIRAGKDRQQVWSSAYLLAEKLVGVEAAGILATYLFSMWREGPIEGVKSRTQDLLTNPVQFLIDSFIWGSFGPIYGAFYETAVRTATAANEPAEEKWKRAMRIFLPLSFGSDVHDAYFGHGPYKNRSGGERAMRFMNLHLPILHTFPVHWIAGLAGIHMEDPRVKAAVKRAWKWRFDPDNNAVPRHGGTPASRTEQEGEVAMHLRRALEAGLTKSGKSFKHLDRAMAAARGALDPGAYFESMKILNAIGMDDSLRREMKKDIGSEKYRMVEARDRLLDMMAFKADVIYPEGARTKALRNEFDNKIYTITHPKIRPLSRSR